jgi:formylglycine-generating enzyme required for sulfatase activity
MARDMKNALFLFPLTALVFTACTQVPTEATLKEEDFRVPVQSLPRSGAMVRIPAAGKTFSMGQPNPDYFCANCSSDEQPVHSVTFTRDFWMDTTEACLPGDPLVPIHGITWCEAVLYCNARSRAMGLDTVYAYSARLDSAAVCTALVFLTVDAAKRGFRLPTEAEWEFACRAGSGTAYYWGDRVIDAFAWYAGDTDAPRRPAGKWPNGFGLYDMAGNVSEFCFDFFGTYPDSAQSDPAGPASGGNGRVYRGGSWKDGGAGLRSACRGAVREGTSLDRIGLRCVRMD